MDNAARSTSGTGGEIDAKGSSPPAIAEATAPPDAFEHALGVSQRTRPIRLAGGEFSFVACIAEDQPSMTVRHTVANLALVAPGRPDLQTMTQLPPRLPLAFVTLKRQAVSEPLNDAGSLGKAVFTASRPGERLLRGRIGVPNATPGLAVGDPIAGERARDRARKAGQRKREAAEHQRTCGEAQRTWQVSPSTPAERLWFT